MGYLPKDESAKRVERVRGILNVKSLDLALVYYDEFNIGNGWYLTGWCPQFESGAVLVPSAGQPMLLGGPESEPFAKLDSAIAETRNFPVFMVPDEEYPNATILDFKALFQELKRTLGGVKRIGLVGGPNSRDELRPGMTVCVDVSFFGHPEFNGVRIETGYEITERGSVPFSPKMDALHTGQECSS